MYIVNYVGSCCSETFIYDGACYPAVYWFCDDSHENYREWETYKYPERGKAFLPCELENGDAIINNYYY